MIDLKVTTTKKLDDGAYEGVIIDIWRDTKEYDYTYYKIGVDKEDIALNVSFPSNVTILGNGEPSSGHAKFLKNMGIDLKDDMDLGKAIDSLKDKKVKFLVENISNAKGEFSTIVKSSVKLK